MNLKIDIYKDEYNSEGVYQGTKYYRNVSILLNDEAII